MSKFVDAITDSTNELTDKVSDFGPMGLIIGGAIGLVAAGVFACVDTYKKLPAVIDDHKVRVNDIAQDYAIHEDYSEKDLKKDMTRAYFKTGVQIIKAYKGPIIIATVSLVGITTMAIKMRNDISELKVENNNLAATLLTVETMFKDYRENVKNDLGEEADRKYRFGVKDVEYEEEVTDEKGKTKTVKKKATAVTKNLDGYSDYARFFDESCYEWDPNPEYNLEFLKTQEAVANQTLRTNKHLFLNEVYDMLGIPRTEAGQVVGWIYDDENPVGDNCVDFGIFNAERERNRAFVNGYEPVILLDFNVDGNILSHLKRI